MRRLAVVLGIVVAIIVVAVLIFWATFDVNHYRGRIQAELESRLGRKITLGQMHLSLLPPSFQVDNLSIADDPSFANPRPFVQADQLDVSVKLLPLLHGTVDINSLNLRRPTVELVKNRQGIWNFSSLGNTITPEHKPSDSSHSFSLSQLTVADGQVAITDMQTGQPRAVYDHVDLTLKDFAPSKPFTVQVAAHMPGPGTQEVKLQGEGGPIAKGDPTATPFNGTLELSNVGIAGLQKFLKSPALNNLDGTLSGQTRISSEAGKLSASGQTTIQNARINGLDVGYPISANYDLTDELQTSLITIGNGNIKLGQTPLSVSGTVNTKPTPADINLNLRANSVSIAEAARLASAFGVAFAPGTTVNGQMTANIQARGAADKPALNGTASAANVQISGKDVPQPIQIQTVHFVLTPNEIHSDNFNVTSGATTVATVLGLRQYTSKTPIINATLQAPNAQLPAVLSMAKAYGVTGLDKISGVGTLNLNLHLAGPVQSITSAEVVKALNGNLNLNFNNVRLNSTDVTHQLATIAGFLKPGQNDQGFTNISHMTGSVVVNNGVAQTNNLQALLDVGTISVTGTANLVTQALNLRLNAVLSQGFSQQVGGTGVGGFMNTALANNQGELVIPVVVTGTVQSPRFAPDLQSVTQMKLKGLLPNSNNPSGAASGILGGLLGPNKGNQTQQQQQQDAVQQILGGILGGKKQPKNNQQNPPQ